MAKKLPTGPIVAILLVVAAMAWLFTGTSEGETAEQPEAAEQPAPDTVPTVQARTLQAEDVRRDLSINGVTEPSRIVAVSSEAGGRVQEVLKEAGDSVARNELIARIDPQDLEARLRSARAFQEQSRLEYEAAQRLGDQGLQNRAQIAAARSQYEEAQAQIESLELSLRHTEIRAPFAGVLESRTIEEGSYVSPGQTVGELYDYTPLHFVGDVPETRVGFLSIGQPATVSLVTGEQLDGEITFIASAAKPTTRTFEVKIAVADSPRQIAGATASASVQLDEQPAHYISPALLNINDAGEMGLKTVNDDNEVSFTPVEIIRSDTGGTWVTGLGESPRVIVVGQGFVNPGDRVDTVAVDGNDDLAAGL